MYLDRLRQGSVSTCESGEIVVDRGSAVVLDARHALGQLIGDQAPRLPWRARGRTEPPRCRRPPRFPFRRRAALRHGDCDGRMRRHRDVQHAPADAGVRAAPSAWSATIRSPSRFHGGAIPARARHGDERGRHGQDPAGGEGRANRSRRPGRFVTTAPRPPNPAEAIAGMLLPAAGPKGFGLALHDRPDVRASFGRGHGDAVGRSMRRSGVP